MKSTVLIISNAALNNADSNGRTLVKLVSGLCDYSLASFFTYGEPDVDSAIDYYKVSDADALRSFCKRQKKDGHMSVQPLNISKVNKKTKKTPFKMLIREFVWQHGCWNNLYLKKWIDNLELKCILLAAADNCFLLNFARKIAKEKHVPIIFYSTEEYPFKNYNYITKRPSLFYFIWHKKLLNAYKKITKFIKFGIFNSESLSEMYKKKYGFESHTIYNSSDVDWIENENIQSHPVISYLGNLGLNRQKPLIEISNVISELFPNIKLDVYGRSDNKVIQELAESPNINFKGFVSYNEVVKIIHNSTLLVHVEYNDKFYNRDLKYAFSTKIADSVCSGTPLLIYAPIELCETSFLEKHKCAFVASNMNELKETIRLALMDINARKAVLNNAKYVRNIYFSNNGSIKKLFEGI